MVFVFFTYISGNKPANKAMKALSNSGENAASNPYIMETPTLKNKNTALNKSEIPIDLLITLRFIFSLF